MFGSTASRHGSRMAASPIIMWSSPDPARRPARGACRPIWSTPTVAGTDVENRIDVIAPHPLRDPALRRLPGAALASGSAGRAKASRSRWRPSTCSARRSVPPPSVSRGARWTRRCACRRRGKLFGAPLSDLQMTQAALADMATGVDSAGAPRLSRRLDQGPGRAAGDARGGDGQDACHRDPRRP